MTFSRNRWLPVLIAALSLSTVARIQELTHEQYTEAVRDAYHKGEGSYPLRQISVERTYNSKGKVLSLIEETDEWAANDIERKISDETVSGRRQRIEVVWIAGVYYCRRNSGKWEIEPQNCSPVKGWGLSLVISRTYSSRESLLKGEKVLRLKAYTTGRDRETGPIAFFQEEIWIGKDGLIIRKETSRGIAKPRSVMWSRSEVFNYGAKDVKIERPIS